MNICMIGCWYRDDIYSHSCSDLIGALKNTCGLKMNLVTSNCNCFSSSQKFSCTKSELINTDCKIITIPYAPPDPTKKYGLFKYYLVKIMKLNFFLEVARGISFYRKTKSYDLIHFDQVLKSFGFLSFLTFLILSKKSNKKIVVTVHEIDPFQGKHRSLNKYYNKADKIIVHSRDLRDEMINMGIRKDKIEIIPYGVSLEEAKQLPRDQFIFFGGHRLLRGKGYDTLLDAIKIVLSRGFNIKVIIYVGEGCIGLEEGQQKAHDMGLDKYIIWNDFLYGSKLAEAYQRSIGCIIPYTGGSGRYPVTSAMANATPVIATQKASIPEYLGESGIYVSENAPEELADAIIRLTNDARLVDSVGRELRERAQELFAWDVIARKTFTLYKNQLGIAADHGMAYSN